MYAFAWGLPLLLAGLTAGAPAAAPVPQSSASPNVQASPRAPSSPVAAPSGRLAGVAPADMYFGPFGMSPLSIRSTIGLLGRQYHYRTISDHDLLRKALLTEDALRLWRAKYPSDPWLAPTFFHLEQLYQAVQTEEARKHATAILKDVVRNYPNSKEGRLSQSRLAAGFPPLLSESPLVASPAPADSASPAAPVPQASASPVAGIAGSASPPGVAPASPGTASAPSNPTPVRSGPTPAPSGTVSGSAGTIPAAAATAAP